MLIYHKYHEDYTKKDLQCLIHYIPKHTLDANNPMKVSNIECKLKC